MTSYYDLVLGIIPVALLGITGVLSVVGFSLTAAVPFGSIAAIGVMGHAMFVNGPVDDPCETPRSAEVTTTEGSGAVASNAD